jgi:biopolymer transport protein ExbB
MRINGHKQVVMRISKWIGRTSAVLIIGAVSAVFALPGEAGAWWNDQWKYRTKLSIDGPADQGGGGSLTDFTLLVRLHSGNFDFTKAKVDGSDIRFLDAGDQTALPYHFEKFDSIDEIGLVWIKVPRIGAGPGRNFLYMYYGNPAAGAGGDSAGSYGVHQTAVYHLDEREGPPRDATAYQNHAGAYSAGQGFPSIIGEGYTLNGVNDTIVIPAAPSLAFADGLTFSAWVKIAMAREESVLFSRPTGDGTLSLQLSGTTLYGRFIQGEESIETGRAAELTAGTWHLAALTMDAQGRMAVFLDGVEIESVGTGAAPPETEADLTIGASPDGDRYFAGDIDEVRVANISRPAEWLLASFDNQRPGSTLVAVGTEEVGEGESGLPVFYLGTVARNITLDGWIVIGVLVLLAALSWIVFVGKAVILAMNAKDNRGFLAAYEEGEDPFEVEDEEEEFPNSPIFRVYQTGCEEMRDYLKVDRLVGNNGYSPKALSALKGGLEKAYVRETQRLNAWLVILTMTISGGPFLGLLGTVWGVMNTFAAMAEAGEANLMAIAPGVASALSTTVFGLLVAIPSLFSYNYLATKIKNMTANMAVFIDELAMRTELGPGEKP